MDVGKLPNHVNAVLCVWLFFFWRFFFSIFLFLSGLKFQLNSQHVQVYDDIWKLIILYPIDFRIIFSKFLLQPGPPKCSFLATPLVMKSLEQDFSYDTKLKSTQFSWTWTNNFNLSYNTYLLNFENKNKKCKAQYMNSKFPYIFSPLITNITND